MVRIQCEKIIQEPLVHQIFFLMLYLVHSAPNLSPNIALKSISYSIAQGKYVLYPALNRVHRKSRFPLITMLKHFGNESEGEIEKYMAFVP